jgi:hypothetical protein
MQGIPIIPTIAAASHIPLSSNLNSVLSVKTEENSLALHHWNISGMHSGSTDYI